jgi:hypothetical protein
MVAKSTEHFPKTLTWRNARKRSAAPSRARRAGFTVQVPFFQILKIPNPKISNSYQIPDEPGEVRILSLPLRWPRAFRPADPFSGFVSPLDRFFLIFPDLGPTFSGPKKHRKNTSSQNAPKSQKSGVQVIFGPILVTFWIHFGILLPEN